MKQFIRLLLGLIPCLFLACDYSPSGSHYEDLNPTPEVIGDLTLDPEQDTVWVRGIVNLHYNISLPNRSLYEHKLKLNNKTIGEGNTVNGSFYLHSNSYQNGFHTLQLVVLASSGTGSLADKAGAEAVEIYRTWVLHIDNSPPKPVAVTKVQPEDGRMKIEWQPYKGTGFEEYGIIRNFGPYYGGVCAIITDPAQTSWIDHDYVGGDVSYAIVLSVNGIASGILGPAVSYNYPLPHILSTSYNEAQELTVKFSSTPFYNNFGKYELRVNNAASVYSNERKDTVFTIPTPAFGGDLDAMLNTHGKREFSSSIPAWGTHTRIAGPGSTWGPHAVESLFSRPASGFFYASSPETLKVIDATTLEVTHERDVTNLQYYGAEGQHVVSPDGRYMYAVLERKIHRLNPNTLQTMEVFDVKDLLPAGDYFLGSLSGCSNSNRLVVHAQNTSAFGNPAYGYVMDMERKQVLVKKEAPIFTDITSISPDGKTIRIDNNMYKAQVDGTWQQLERYGYELGHTIFHPTKPLFYTTYGPDIVFYSTETGARQYTLRPEVELYDVEIDAGSGHLYGHRDNVFYIYNIETGELLRKLKLTYSAKVFLYKDRIFSKDRYIAL